MTIGPIEKCEKTLVNNLSPSPVICQCITLPPAGVLHNGPKSEEKLIEDCVVDCWKTCLCVHKMYNGTRHVIITRSFILNLDSGYINIELSSQVKVERNLVLLQWKTKL